MKNSLQNLFGYLNFICMDQELLVEGLKIKQISYDKIIICW